MGFFCFLIKNLLSLLILEALLNSSLHKVWVLKADIVLALSLCFNWERKGEKSLKIKLHGGLLLSGKKWQVLIPEAWRLVLGVDFVCLLWSSSEKKKRDRCFLPPYFFLTGFSYLVSKNPSIHIFDGSIILLYYIVLEETGRALNCRGLWMLTKIKANWGIYFCIYWFGFFFLNKNKFIVRLVYWL